MHCLYVICERNFYSRTHVKITQLWKSTLRVLKMAATVYETNNFAGGGGGRGYTTNFHLGRLRPEVQPLTLLYIIFLRKRYPFCIPSVNKVVPLSRTLSRTLQTF